MGFTSLAITLFSASVLPAHTRIRYNAVTRLHACPAGPSVVIRATNAVYRRFRSTVGPWHARLPSFTVGLSVDVETTNRLRQLNEAEKRFAKAKGTGSGRRSYPLLALPRPVRAHYLAPVPPRARRVLRKVSARADKRRESNQKRWARSRQEIGNDGGQERPARREAHRRSAGLSQDSL
jgi:hypothetical protein